MSTLTIERDSHAEAAQSYLVMDERHQILGDHYPWLQHLRRMTNNDRLFVFFHRETFAFVLAAWIYSPAESSRPVCMELEVFFGHPSEEWPRGLREPEDMRQRLKPVQERMEAAATRRRDKLNALRSKRVDNAYARREGAKTARKLGLYEASHQIASGAVPYDAVQNGDRVRQITELLKELRKGL